MAPLLRASLCVVAVVHLTLGAAAALEGQGGCTRPKFAAALSDVVPGTCAAGMTSAVHREDVLLQVHHRRQHELNRSNRTSNSGYCCLTDECGSCSNVAAGTWCSRGKVSCDYFCRGTWCAAPDTVATPKILPAPEEAGRCCLAAKDQTDACGTCESHSWAASGTWCAQSRSNCGTCSDGTAVWCGEDRVPTPSTTLPLPPSSEAPTPSTTLPLPPSSSVEPQLQLSDASCCLSYRDSADACGTCYPHAFASPGDWCLKSQTNCQACSGAWCEGTPAATAAPSTTAPTQQPTTSPPATSTPYSARPTEAPTPAPWSTTLTLVPSTTPPSVPSEGRCCFAAVNAGDFCGTCYPSAFAAPGDWCGASEDRCRICVGTWCSGSGASTVPPTFAPTTPAPTPAPTTPAPTPSPTTAVPAPAPTTPAATPAPTTPATTQWTTPSSAAPVTTASTTTMSTTSPTTVSITTTATTTTVTTQPPPTPSPSTTPASGPWISGTWTTGYWDCCKPSCAWAGKGHVNKPTLACDARTGERLFDANVKSVCDGGSAAACADNAPFLVNKGLSMGFAAVAVSGNHGLVGDANCGQCFELKFVDRIHPEGNWGGSHPDLVGKSMIVQVTNIGYDVVGEHSFDIQIPGAGQGIFTSGCTAQFAGFSAGDFDCDNHYGGCSEKAGCARLPEVLRKPCEWRYDWYRWLVAAGRTNNPYVDFRRVRCPEQLTRISGSVALDDAEFPAVDVNSYA